MFIWGWHADYPDPENFFFLLGSDTSPDPNYTQYKSQKFDFYFGKLKFLTNEESATWFDSEQNKDVSMTRFELINKCKEILAEECPWISLYHDVYFELNHGWVKNVKAHPLVNYPYNMYDIDMETRNKNRIEWNKPVYWPVFALSTLFIIFIVPILKTYIRERN